MEPDLQAIINAYRDGDTEAQEKLLEQVQPMVRRLVRSAMGGYLRTIEESVDLSQSLLLAFHMQIAGGRAVFDNEAALRGYLRRMVSHKMASRARSSRAQKRGGGVAPTSFNGREEIILPRAVDNTTPSAVFHVKEMRTALDNELDEEERFILEGRLLGRTFGEIATDLDKTPDAVRMIWNRSRDRMVERGIVRGHPGGSKT
ncbi:MAG: RNA polymerase sigma factor [Planctomycetota bacterium]|jgi:RNA polymerase sigma factor (sigma-70 family)